jgi:hypothetical protein
MSEKRGSQHLPPLLPATAKSAVANTKAPLLDLPRKRVVVNLACDECRKRKIKCDGCYPACSRCLTNRRSCAYDGNPAEPRAVSKKRKNDQLNERMYTYEHLCKLLVVRDTQEVAMILDQLRQGKTVESIVRAIEEGNLLLALRVDSDTSTRNVAVSHVPTANNVAHISPLSHTLLDKESGRLPPPRARLASTFDNANHIFEKLWESREYMHPQHTGISTVSLTTLPITRWTDIIDDELFCNHLLMLFWTWDTTGNRLVDRNMLEQHISSLDPTTTTQTQELRFCSKFLINALLAVSCVRHSTRSAVQY